jgi:hypothetical protein
VDAFMDGGDVEVVFSGVIVGFEDMPEHGGRAVYVQGSVDNSESSFYVILPDDKYEELLQKGVGRMISGRAVIVSREPELILRYVGEE